MRRTISALTLLSTLSILAVSVSAGSLAQPAANYQTQKPTPETQAFDAISAAPTVDAKVAAAEAFLKTYPKSASRPQVLEIVVVQIGQVKDANQAVALAERVQPLYTSPEEQDSIKTLLVQSYSSANRPDDAFKVGGELLAKDPDNVQVLVQLALAGTEQVKQKNTKYAAQSLQYGLKAIELIEADKKPPRMSDAFWASHKAAIPQLYQQTAILNLITGNNQEAKTRLIKTTTLSPKDPYPYALLGFILNDEYTKQVPVFQAMPVGTAKETEKKRLEGLLDNIIDVYAHVAGLSTNKPEYQALMQQVVPDLTGYYKYRHNQSTDGLQQLIDKYKPQP